MTAASDQFEHIIVAQADGRITEAWFGGAGAGGSDELAHVPGVVSLAAYWSAGDNHQRAIAADRDGAVHEIWFSGGGRASGQDVRAKLSRLSAVTGYFAGRTGDGFEHVITAAGDGTLRELYWTP